MSGTIGILAYGSLIDDPGDEIRPLITDRIACKTPPAAATPAAASLLACGSNAPHVHI